jgi:hypothetical protein
MTVMASSMKLEYPLMDVLPNIEHARDRLLARIFHYRKHPQASQLTTDEDYALLYAYSKLSLVPSTTHERMGALWSCILQIDLT